MAIIINQKPDGVSIGFDRGKWSGTSAYVIRDDAGAQIDSSQIMGTGGVIAKLGPTEFGGSSGALGDLGSYWSSRMRQVSFELKQQDAGGYVWEATVNFDSNVGDPTTTPVDQKNEGQQGFTAVELSVQGEPVDIWRTGATMPTGSNIDSPTDTDIGGTKVDSGGEPISTFVNIARITYRQVVVGRPTVPLAAINTRNSASYSVGAYSFAARTLLFTGCSVSRVGVSTYEIVYTFAYDANFHLRQIATRMPDTREVQVGAKADTCGSTPTSSDKAYALCVYWRQPFPSTGAFASTIGTLA
jgi:hypothetical protein